MLIFFFLFFFISSYSFFCYPVITLFLQIIIFTNLLLLFFSILFISSFFFFYYWYWMSPIDFESINCFTFWLAGKKRVHMASITNRFFFLANSTISFISFKMLLFHLFSSFFFFSFFSLFSLLFTFLSFFILFSSLFLYLCFLGIESESLFNQNGFIIIQTKNGIVSVVGMRGRNVSLLIKDSKWLIIILKKIQMMSISLSFTSSS